MTENRSALSVDVVRAAPNELHAVCSILQEAVEWLTGRGETLWEPTAIMPEAMLPAMTRQELYLVKHEDVPVGTVILQWEDRKFWPEAVPGEGAYLHKLAVRRSVAGQGVSQAIIAWATHMAAANGKRFLRLDCAPRPKLQAFYEGQGFKFHSNWRVGHLAVARYEINLEEN
jgi:GNAT superfamily N-acetyltransferase